MREQRREGGDFEHAAFVPRRVELLNRPAVNVRVVVPRLRFAVLVLAPLRLLNASVFAGLHRRSVVFASAFETLDVQRERDEC